MNVIFHNMFHNGDCFISKGWVEELIEKIPNSDFYYVHKNHPDILKDIKANYVDVRKVPFVAEYAYTAVLKSNSDEIFINAWKGAVLLEGHSTFVRQHNIYKQICQYLKEAIGIEINPSEDPKYYISSIDYERYDKKSADNFIETYVQNKPMFLFCNNPVKSIQSDVGDMKNVLSELCDRYKDCVFVSTYDIDLEKDNLYYTSKIFNKEFDLNEIGYLSTYAKLIVGKNSGAHIFTHLKENLENPDKVMYTLSHTEEDTLPHGLDFQAKIKFSSLSKDEDLIDLLKQCIDEDIKR